MIVYLLPIGSILICMVFSPILTVWYIYLFLIALITVVSSIFRLYVLQS